MPKCWTCASETGARLAVSRKMFGASLKPGDTFRFAGMDLEVESDARS